MKHGLFAVCAVVFLVMAGCVFESDDDVGQDNQGGSLYAETYWGEWIRMDADETWYISGETIKIDDRLAYRYVSLAKQSDRVIKVTEGGKEYYLYASRIASASFTGRIASFEEVSTSVSLSAAGGVSPSKVNGGLGLADLVIQDINNGKKQTVQTDDEGKYKAEDIIPGDTYEITPEGGTPVTVTPQGDGDDVGTITVTDGANFKTSINHGYYANRSQEVLYAGTQYNFTLRITNVGTEDCEAATYHLGFEDGLITPASTAEDVFQTIEPGKTKTLSLSLMCGPIEEVFADKKISITITDQLSKKTWEDSVSVRFYRGKIPFYVRAEKPINGIIISPQNQTYRFSGTDTSVTVPWVPGEYLVVFSGADADMQTRYSFGVFQRPESDFSGFTDLAKDEPENNTEQTAPEISGTSGISNLHKNDIDYYRYRVPEPEEVVPPSLSLEESLAWLSENAVLGSTYPVTLNGDETIGPQTFSYGGKYVTIILDGGTAERTVNLSSNGALFTVGSGVTLRLGNNITLRGRASNSSALVRVESGGTLEMNSGSKISGNTNSAIFAYGGGVYVSGDGTFTMSGGEISGNTDGGVYVSYGTFAMSGGTISGNSGHGVYVSSSTFTMSGGEISGNTSGYGGGVVVSNGTFRMSGGEISGNSASGTSYQSYGGGVYGSNGGTFTMSGGEISGNTSSGSGGGVYVSSFTFIKQSGGTIYGSNASDTLKNTAKNGGGHAVHVSSGQRNSTAGESVTLDSTKSGTAGGWE
ncbi:MAG: right-handed parallel beta-helix repeat-containing protein [Spirochaetaceae bacterium]|jgi:hypothetical protein|nr:right-handed parallel beta-helix repeat-containing protein [Spirochaetaceae bacterium]